MSLFGAANRVPNPSFEDVEPVYWTLAGEADITDAYGAVTGVNALFLDQQYSTFGPIHTFSSTNVPLWNLRTDRTYAITFKLQLYAVSGTQNHTFTVQLDTNGDGSVTGLQNYRADDFTVGEWTEQTITGVALTVTASLLQLRATLPATVDGRTRWLVDDVRMEIEDPAPGPPAVGEDTTLPGTRPGPKVGYRNAHVDTLHGTLIDEPDVAHDRHDRTRHINDIGDLDRDEQDRPLRYEDPPPEP